MQDGQGRLPTGPGEQNGLHQPGLHTLNFLLRHDISLSLRPQDLHPHVEFYHKIQTLTFLVQPKATRASKLLLQIQLVRNKLQ